MYWTLELASHLEDAPWPATKDELIDYAIRSGAPVEVDVPRSVAVRSTLCCIALPPCLPIRCAQDSQERIRRKVVVRTP